MAHAKERLGQEQLDGYIAVAAREAGHKGFGEQGCDLGQPTWWVAYIRQSLEEQTQNSRLPDYLRTCAQEARELGVVVPREYVLYDAVTGEHLERPSMIHLRRLMAERRIAGILFPALDRLSREPLHQQIFELEAEHYGVKLHYADVPNGTDLGSQFARGILTYAAKLVKEANHKNARGGNIGRVMKGWVPAHRAAYGYRYRADRQIGPDGRVVIKRAWWEVDELGPDGTPLEGSPAWVVVQMFTWVGDEGRSLYWVAKRLNEMGITAPAGGKWSPARVGHIVHHRCYTGSHVYNANAKVPNPDRPLGDITAQVKRTLLRPKPEEEWVRFTVPALVTEELWRKADVVVTERGRGRGKEGRAIQALFRNRIFCPRCGKAMVVRRDGHQQRVYYHCSKYFRPWAGGPCGYRRFIPATWDDLLWEDVCSLLRSDTWVEEQVASERSRDENAGKLVRLTQFKKSQAEARICKVQEGFEGGLYSLEEAQRRMAQHQATVTQAEEEIRRLRQEPEARPSSSHTLDLMRGELRALRDRNLGQAAFEEKLDVVAKLGIKVFPAEDLKSMRVTCQLDLDHARSNEQADGAASGETGAEGESEPRSACGKVRFGPPSWIKDRTFACTFELPS
ncbi:MAG: recombinase family protein, partial [Dehalococcoidia bacterium]